MQVQSLINIFESHFQGKPRVFRSPGRINIIGEHTDYNQGFVLPAGVDKEIVVLLKPNNSDEFNLVSVDQNEQVTFNLNNYQTIETGWAKYIIGIIDQALKAGLPVKGFDCVFGGDIPIGAGLSSSAALECATLYGLNKCFQFGLDSKQIALMAQAAENKFVGVNCGIMDQFASVFAQESHAIKLDCRDLSYETFEIQFGDYGLLLIDSMVKHSLASSEYNLRRAECETAVETLRLKFSEITSLREANLEQLESIKNHLTQKVYDRAKYVIEEIERVSLACKAIDRNDLQALGSLIYASHSGLQHLYQVSCEELDFLVDYTRDNEAVLGARMMGGGFGGCTINLVRKSQIGQLKEDVTQAYQERYEKAPNLYEVQTANGSSEVG